MMKANRRRLVVSALAAAPAVVFLSVFFLWPVIAILVRGFSQSNVGESFANVFTDPVLRRVMQFTFVESVLSTVACVVLGVAGAATFANFSFRGKSFLRAAIVIPFVMPTVVMGVAMLVLIGRDGLSPVQLSGTLTAIVLAHVFFNYAIVTQTVSAAWSSLDQSLIDSAKTLGASGFQSAKSVYYPLLRPAILAAASLVFLFSFTSFGIVLILGSINQRTIEVEIYEQTAKFLRLDTAATLVIVQLVVIAAVFVLSGYFNRRIEQRTTSLSSARSVKTKGERVFVFANIAIMGAVIFAPLFVVVGKSFSTPNGWGWQWYVDIFSQRKGSTAFVSPTDAIINSFLYGLVTVLIAVVIGSLAASTLARAKHSFWQGLADVVVSLPLGTSAVTVGFGYILVFSTSSFDLRQSFWIVPIAHSVIAMPLVIRIVLPSMKSRDMAIDDAAKVLGASWWRKLCYIDLPLLRQPLTVAAAFAFAVSLGEFGATAFLARPDRPTLPIAIYRTLGRPGESSFGQAMALSVILMVFLTIAVAIIARNAKSTDSRFL